MGDALATRWRFPAFRRSGRALATEGTVHDQTVTIVKPQTYMNLSGEALETLRAREHFQVSRDLLVLVDEFALPLGTFRLRARGSAGGHRGLESVEATFGTRDYCRLRIGIGPLPDHVHDWADYVLAPFTRAEQEMFIELVPVLGDAVECWITDGIETAMNRFNRRGSQSD